MNCSAKYRYLLLIVVYIFFGSASGQKTVSHLLTEDTAALKTIASNLKAQYDSLATLIASTPDDTLKVLRLNLLFVLQGAHDIGIPLRAEKLAGQLQYPAGLAESYIKIGSWYQEQNNFSTAVSFYTRAISIDETYQYYTEIFPHYGAVLNVYFYTGNFPAAMQLTMQALAYAEKTGNTRMIAIYNNIFGFIYLREGNFVESKKYYTRYFDLAKQLKDSMMLADGYNCVGDVYNGLGKYNYALHCFITASNIYARNSRIQKAYRNERLAYTLNKISSTYALSGNYLMAAQYDDSVFKYASIAICNKYDLAAYYINSGDIYNRLKNYKAALAILNSGLVLAKKIQHSEDIRDAYNALAKTYAGLHKYDSAYIFSTLHAQLKDSIVNQESRFKIAAIQEQYDNEKKDIKTASENLLRNIIILALLVFITIVFLLYSRYLLKQKNKFQSQVYKQQSDLFNAVVSAQDAERKRIAQDIHDSLGSVLSAAKLNLSDLEADKYLLTKPRREKYETALALLDDASADLRNISHNLMPATLLKLGLTAALQNLFDKISANGININFITHEVKERMHEAIEISIYRIILELVNNVVKHAKASEVTVQIVKYPSYVNITVEDNGGGFNYRQTAAETKGMGLSNALSRIEYFKGTMNIDSAAGGGTTVIIDIPAANNMAGA